MQRQIRGSRGRQVSRQREPLRLRARQLGAAHAARELVESQPTLDGRVAQQRDRALAVRVGGAHELVHSDL
jgi:hypothetical protein